MKKWLLFIPLLCIYGAFFSPSRFVFAQDTESISGDSLELGVSPATAFLKIQQGGTTSHTVTLENTSTHSIRVTPKIVDFTSDNTTGNPILAESTTFSYLDENQDPSQFDTVLLKPKEKAALKLSFAVPTNAPAKEYPLTILFESAPETPTTPIGAGAGIKTVIGSNLIVLISDSDELPTLLSITSLNTPTFIDSFSGISFAPSAHNDSFAASVASGSATITNWRGKLVASAGIAPAVVLGNSSRILQPISAIEGQNKFIHKPAFLFGLYTITVSLETGTSSNSEITTHVKRIIALPFAGIAIIFSIIVMILFIFYKKRKNSLLHSITKMYYTDHEN